MLTSANIDEELEFERALLTKNIREKHEYRYTENYSRDHPNVRFDVYEGNTGRTKRRVRLSHLDDDTRTFTVLRRDSLEREPAYRPHDDPDYQYTNKNNERFSRLTMHEKPFKKEFKLGKGEYVARQFISDMDGEIYTKHNQKFTRPKPQDFVMTQRPTDRFKFKEEDSRLYYGDLNDVSMFEENIVNHYGRTPHIKRYKDEDRYISNGSKSISSSTTPVHVEHYVQEVDNVRTFRERNSEIYEFDDRPFTQAPDISMRGSKLYSPVNYERRSGIKNNLNTSTRFSNVSAIPKSRDTLGTFKQQLENYRMIDRDDDLSSGSNVFGRNTTLRESRVVNNNAYSSGNAKSSAGLKYTPKSSTYTRTTGVTTSKKSKINPAYSDNRFNDSSW